MYLDLILHNTSGVLSHYPKIMYQQQQSICAVKENTFKEMSLHVLLIIFIFVSSWQSAYILFYMTIVGHALSIASLLISLAIFFYFR